MKFWPAFTYWILIPMALLLFLDATGVIWPFLLWSGITAVLIIRNLRQRERIREDRKES